MISRNLYDLEAGAGLVTGGRELTRGLWEPMENSLSIRAILYTRSPSNLSHLQIGY